MPGVSVGGSEAGAFCRPSFEFPVHGIALSRLKESISADRLPFFWRPFRPHNQNLIDFEVGHSCDLYAFAVACLLRLPAFQDIRHDPFLLCLRDVCIQ